MDIKEIVYEDVERIPLPENRVNNEPSGCIIKSENFLSN